MWHVWRVWHKNMCHCGMCHMPYLSPALMVWHFLVWDSSLWSPVLNQWSSLKYIGCFTYFLSQRLCPSCVTHVTSHLVTRIPFVFWPIAWAHSFLLRENNHLIETDKDQCHQSILKHIKECSYSSFGKRDVCDVQLAKLLSFQKFIWNDHGCRRQF